MELHTKNFDQLVVGFKRGDIKREWLVGKTLVNCWPFVKIFKHFSASSNFYICYTVTGNNAAVAIATAIQVYLTTL